MNRDTEVLFFWRWEPERERERVLNSHVTNKHIMSKEMPTIQGKTLTVSLQSQQQKSKWILFHLIVSILKAITMQNNYSESN